MLISGKVCLHFCMRFSEKYNSSTETRKQRASWVLNTEISKTLENYFELWELSGPCSYLRTLHLLLWAKVPRPRGSVSLWWFKQLCMRPHIQYQDSLEHSWLFKNPWRSQDGFFEINPPRPSSQKICHYQSLRHLLKYKTLNKLKKSLARMLLIGCWILAY